MNAFGVASTLGAGVNSLANALGLDGWGLKTGKYNGCTFFAVASIPLLENSALYKAGEDIISTVNQFTGGKNDGQDANRSGQLYNTNLESLVITDKLISGKVIKVTPYSNSVNIEDTGFRGYEFRMTLVFFGDDYLRALANFEQAVLNPPKNPAQYLVLEHPTRGKINGYTYVVGDLEVITSVAYWRGCVVNVLFRSVQTPQQITAPELSTAQKVFRALQATLGAVSALGGTIANIQGFGKNYNILKSAKVNNVNPKNLLTQVDVTTSSNASIEFNDINSIEVELQDLSNILFNCMLYAYKYGNPPAQIAKLSKSEVDYNYLPPTLNQLKRYTLVQSEIILDYYNSKCKLTIAKIYEINSDGLFNNKINQVNTSISNLYAVLQTIGNKVTTNTYLVPYAMSIRRVLSLNGIPLDAANAVMKLNPSILSSNYIFANTVVNLL
jgi:hypothetical protein